MSNIDNLTNKQTYTKIDTKGSNPLQTGNPKGSTTVNIQDPNFTKKDGHLDEINPSASADFNAKPYNIRIRSDETIPGYDKPRDSWERAGDHNVKISQDPVPFQKQCQ